MNPTSEQTNRRFLAVGRKVLRLCVPGLLALTALAVVAIVPAGATRAPQIKKPDAPIAVTAVAVHGGAIVSWMAPSSDGGSPITGYAVTAPRSGQTCTTTGATTCTVTGLKNGQRYTLKVQASNAIGLGKPSRVQVTTLGVPRRNCSSFGPYAELQGCDLAGANLTGANLTGANLTGTNLTDANLTDANLTDATLTDANLINANLAGANLDLVVSGGIAGPPSVLPTNWSIVSRYLMGPGANLTGADLSGVNLSGTTLTDANLTDANLSDVTILDSNLEQANLTDVNLTDAILSVGSYETAAYLASANLTDANLTGASLSYVYLLGAVLTDTDLSGTYLVYATLDSVESGGITGTPVLPTDWGLVGGYLIGPSATLIDANLTGLNLTGADLPDARLTDANLTGANLTGANLTGATLTGATLTGATWSNTTCPDGTNSNNDGDTCVDNLG